MFNALILADIWKRMSGAFQGVARLKFSQIAGDTVCGYDPSQYTYVYSQNIHTYLSVYEIPGTNLK